MAHINFVIPQTSRDLLESVEGQYYVKDVLEIEFIRIKLKDAKISLKEDGPEFIFDYFDTYFSVLQSSNNFQMHEIIQICIDLDKAVKELNKNLGFILEDKDCIDETLKMKYINVIKMLIYIYTEFVKLIQNKIELKRTEKIQLKVGKGRKKSDDDEFDTFDRKTILLSLNSIIQQDINVLWDPPVVEESLTNMISGICYLFLEDSNLSSNKELYTEIFNILGTLVKSHSCGTSFLVRVVQLVKTCEHVISFIPEGIKILVERYNCKSLVHAIVQELTDWQSRGEFQDNQGAKNCSTVLREMTALMPAAMMPEANYLTTCLYYDSVPLRNSILAIFTELVLSLLSGHDLSEEEKECRDVCLEILVEHVRDVSALVRAKVFQHWARLQMENAVPRKLQYTILDHAVEHLTDKGALVRKNAAACVTEFLKHNLYGANLQLQSFETELAQKSEELNVLKSEIEGMQMEKLLDKERLWMEKEANIKAVIEKHLANEESVPELEVSKNEVSYFIRMYLDNEKYDDAFKIFRGSIEKIEDWKNQRSAIEGTENEVNFFLTFMRAVYMDVKTIEVNEENLNRIKTLEAAVDYLEDTVKFLKILDYALIPMTELLQSVTVSDSTEAVNFFVAAYQFNLNNATEGILEMLNVMKIGEQSRRDVVVEAFKDIYLKTDAENLAEHAKIIADRLITLLEKIPSSHHDNLKIVVSEWASKGLLDNSIIDIFWQYFTKKMDVSEDQSRAALHIISMASLGRKTIITRNVKLIASIAFSERGMNDLLLVKVACDALAVLAAERANVADDDTPFAIPVEEPIWSDLFNILYQNFERPVKFFNNAICAAINFLFKVCSKPDRICEEFMLRVLNAVREKQQASNTKEMSRIVIIRLVVMVGEVALRLYQYLDETVYKELKRRSNIREERNAEKKGTKKKKSDKKKSIANSARKSLNMSIVSNASESDVANSTDAAGESTLVGAQAEDIHAEFILHVLENDIVTGSGGLAKLAPIIKQICEQQVYQDKYLQGVATLAMLRFMLVSSKFCQENIQLIFTILEKTPYTTNKCTILLHCSDLLERFPNVIEPWTPRIYARLKDEDRQVRRTTFYVLADLILRDLILAKGNISEMARCMSDDDQEMANMSKQFFTNLSRKVNSLYSVLPDIFSHLCNLEDLSVQDLQDIMKFLFGLIDKTKYMENLVDRFCAKFKLNEDPKTCANITYCLTLINYNEKALGRLLDNFGLYKHLLHDSDIYGMFKQIINNANRSGKPTIKTITTEIEQNIQSVFDVEEEDAASTGVLKPRQLNKPPKSAKKSRQVRKKRAKVVESDDDDNDNENESDDDEVFATPARPQTREKARQK